MESYFNKGIVFYYFMKLICMKQKSIHIGQKFVKWIEI